MSQLHDLCLYMYLNELKEYISIVESSNSDSEKVLCVFSSSCEHAFHVLVRIKVLALTMQKCIFLYLAKNIAFPQQFTLFTWSVLISPFDAQGSKLYSMTLQLLNAWLQRFIRFYRPICQYQTPRSLSLQPLSLNLRE